MVTNRRDGYNMRQRQRGMVVVVDVMSGGNDQVVMVAKEGEGHCLKWWWWW